MKESLQIQGRHYVFYNSLFNFQGLNPVHTKGNSHEYVEIWGYSSAGRAPALQAGGQRFDPAYLHQREEPRLKALLDISNRLEGKTEKPENMGL